MSDPKRYLAKCPWYVIETQEHPMGEFVLYSDYASLKTNVERLEKEVWRMKVFKGIDEDTKATLKDALMTVPEWAKVFETIENNARLETENIALKAEVERVGAENSHLHKGIYSLSLNVGQLKPEVERLTKADDFIVIQRASVVSIQEVYGTEDAPDNECKWKYFIRVDKAQYDKVLKNMEEFWSAKEGKQP